MDYSKMSKEVAQYMRRVTKQVKKYKDFDETMLNGLDLLAMNYESIWTAWRIIEAEGPTTLSGQGAVQKHPAWDIMQKGMTNVFALSKEYGITPMAKVRVMKNTPVDENVSPLELLMHEN